MSELELGPESEDSDDDSEDSDEGDDSDGNGEFAQDETDDMLAKVGAHKNTNPRAFAGNELRDQPTRPILRRTEQVCSVN